MKLRSTGAVVLAAAILTAACGQATPLTRGGGPLPTRALPAKIAANGPCVLVGGRAAPTPGESQTPLEVGSDPLFAVVLWVPGLNARPCRAALTRLDEAEAGALADAINAAPVFPHGTIACPADDGGAADVYLAYDGGASVARVWISLAGCHPVTAQDRWPRKLDASIVRALRAGAPRPWQRYLR